MKASNWSWLFLAAPLFACGGSQPVAETPSDDSETGTSESVAAPKKRGGPSVQSELGEIDQGEAERAFDAAQGAIAACHQKGLGRVEYLAGDVGFLVRIGEDGRARYVVLESSTLGDRETERCMVSALQNARWPKPDGGEAEARRSLSFSPGDAREPFNWAYDKVALLVDEKRAEVQSCKGGASGSYHITLYAQPAGSNGKVQAVGVSASTPEVFAGVDCVVSALKAAKLPSPGSYAAKVSFDL